MLYQDYPTNWPEFTPRDKIAQWLELYVTMQDLVVWTDTELRERPVYDAETREWAVTVSRAGAPVHLRPAHIVLATGTLGVPRVPAIPGVAHFRGRVMHTSAYTGGAPYAGQRVVVIGAGNSSIDVCEDLVYRGAKEVTMVQRSPTCVMARDFISMIVHQMYPPHVPVEVADFKTSSMPLGLSKRLAIASEQFMWESQKELHDKLRKGGVQLYMGAEGQGAYLMIFERGGGYCKRLSLTVSRRWRTDMSTGLDKGGADLIADGRIKVKSGVSPERFTEDGVVLSDGTELSADLVIFA